MRNKNNAILANKTSRAMISKIRIIVVSSIVAVSSLVTVAALLPFYLYRMEAESNNIQQNLKQHSQYLEKYYESLEQVGLQIASRSRARQLMGKLSKQEITDESFRKSIVPILEDAKFNDERIHSIARYDEFGILQVKVGDYVRELPSRKEFSFSRLFLSNGQVLVQLHTKIVDRNGQMYGTDVITFKANDLLQYLHDIELSTYPVRLTLRMTITPFMK